MNPKRLETSDLVHKAQNDIHELGYGQEPLTAPISLYEAMARAIKYNREYRLNMMKSALSIKQVELTRFDMLPDLTLNAGYSKRDNEAASSSESFRTGLESLEPSVSQDRERKQADATFTWNVLDFGLSYVRAQQQSDQYLIAKEVERKTIHNIINDVRVAWWKALSAQRLMKRVPLLMTRVKRVLDQSKEIEQQRLDNPMSALKYQRSLLYMLRTLEDLQKQLLGAKPELASLMGLAPSLDFSVADPGMPASNAATLSWDIEAMEQIALLSRPELLESRYQQRITQKESRIALLRLLPDLNLEAGWDYDANSYLVNHSWYNFGGRISSSLLNLIKMPKILAHAENNEEIQRQQHLVVSSTILMQLHLAKAAHIQSARGFALEEEIYNLEDRILVQKKNESKTGAEGEQALIGQQLNHLLAQFRRDTAYADMRNNFGRLLWTMGVDPIPAVVDDTSVNGLATNIRLELEKWQAPNLKEIEGITAFLPSATMDPIHEEVLDVSVPPTTRAEETL